MISPRSDHGSGTPCGCRQKMVLATSNRGKLAEFQSLLAGLPFELVSATDLLGERWTVDEDGDTFEANARKKAREVAQATGVLTLADDSGLAVDALGGAPGVRSARYAGDDATPSQNVQKLLRAMEHVPEAERGARFCCVLCVVDPSKAEGEEVLVRGECEGMIGREPRGGGGFGYDPVFVVQGGDGRTMAELSPEEKGQVSHRANAVRMLESLMQTRSCAAIVGQPSQ